MKEFLAMLKVKKFTIKAKEVDFQDVKFLSSTEKMKIYKKWISFLNNHFSSKSFSKQLYSHLSCHCGYIAHYDLHGFYGNYFTTGAILNKMAFNVETPMSDYGGMGSYSTNYLGKDAQETKEAFYDVFYELVRGNASSDEGLGGFFYNWNSGGYMGVNYSGDYGDLNSAMKAALDEYIAIWQDVIEDAQDKLKKAEEQTKLKELKEQKKNIHKLIDNANKQLEEIDADIVSEAKSFVEKQDAKPANTQLSLFDYLEVA